jgi:hypothetical protein
MHFVKNSCDLFGFYVLVICWDIASVLSELHVDFKREISYVCDDDVYNKDILLEGEAVSFMCNFSSDVSYNGRTMSIYKNNKAIVTVMADDSYVISPELKHKLQIKIRQNYLNMKLKMLNGNRDVGNYTCDVVLSGLNHSFNSSVLKGQGHLNILKDSILFKPSKSQVNKVLLIEEELLHLTLQQGFDNFSLCVEKSRNVSSQCRLPKVKWKIDQRLTGNDHVIYPSLENSPDKSCVILTEGMFQRRKIYTIDAQPILYGISGDFVTFHIEYVIPEVSSNWWIFFVIFSCVWTPVLLIVLRVVIKAKYSDRPKVYYNASPFFEMSL